MAREDGLDRQEAILPEALAAAVAASLERWDREDAVRRLWTGDARLWTGESEDRWLGWLDIVAAEQRRLDELIAFGEEVRRAGFAHVLLVGMGGSSLGPEVLGQALGPRPVFPALTVLDSTDPAQIRGIERDLDLARTLVIVSSKSGTTLEPDILKRYFFERMKDAVGAGTAGQRFVAITDPGSALDATARADGFRHVFHGRPSIGGRYSVLSDFGMVPAAACGIDVRHFLEAAQRMVRACGANVPAAENPGVVLGTILGVAAQQGRDKVTILASPGVAAFGAWLEQLLAESTGKNGKGIVPVDGEPVARNYGGDRLFVALTLDGEEEAAPPALAEAGHPLVRIGVADRYNLGQEFFRWQVATAVAGSIMGINPFDQPDVEASKVKTRALTAAYERGGRLPPETPILEERGLRLYIDDKLAAALDGASRARTLADWLAAFFAKIAPGDYVALLAYLERNAKHRDALQEIRLLLRERKGVATCLGFGPRFLHSTGQVYKGGPNSGVFLQLTAEAAEEELPVPGQKYGFGIVEAAQARGDLDVLIERGRRALRIDLGRDVPAGLVRLRNAVRHALG
jgi:transaldolase / glucose-6-phosphate isomerase